MTKNNTALEHRPNIKATECPVLAVTSTGHRNTLVKSVCGCFKLRCAAARRHDPDHALDVMVFLIEALGHAMANPATGLIRKIRCRLVNPFDEDMT